MTARVLASLFTANNEIPMEKVKMWIKRNEKLDKDDKDELTALEDDAIGIWNKLLAKLLSAQDVPLLEAVSAMTVIDDLNLGTFGTKPESLLGLPKSSHMDNMNVYYKSIMAFSRSIRQEENCQTEAQEMIKERIGFKVKWIKESRNHYHIRGMPLVSASLIPGIA